MRRGKVAIVTGGDGGLGYPTALALASAGATVYIASRNITSCQTVAQNISAQTRTNARAFGAHVRIACACSATLRGLAADCSSVAALDLASFSSIRSFADAVAVLPPNISRVACAGDLHASSYLADAAEPPLLLPVALRFARQTEGAFAGRGAGWPDRHPCEQRWHRRQPPGPPPPPTHTHTHTLTHRAALSLPPFLRITPPVERAAGICVAAVGRVCDGRWMRVWLHRRSRPMATRCCSRRTDRLRLA